MRTDVLFGIARIAINSILKDLDVTQDYALHAEKDTMMSGLKDYRER